MPTQSQISNLFTKVTDLMTCANTDTVASYQQSACGGWSAAAQQSLNSKLTAMVQKIPTDYQTNKNVARGIADCVVGGATFTGQLGSATNIDDFDAESEPWVSTTDDQTVTWDNVKTCLSRKTQSGGVPFSEGSATAGDQADGSGNNNMMANEVVKYAQGLRANARNVYDHLRGATIVTDTTA